LCFCIVAGTVISEESDGSFSFIAEDAAENDQAQGIEEGGGESDDEEGFSSFDSSFTETSGSSRLAWEGNVGAIVRAYADYADPSSGTVNAYPAVGLNLTYTGDNSEAAAELRFNRNWNYDTPSLEQDLAPQNISWYLQRMIENAYLRLFYDHFDLQVGYFKEVWGTGDQSHVVDPLNPFDYYDFVNNDYIDRKVSEFMCKIDVPLGLMGLLELVYVPVFTPDSSPLTGKWMPESLEPISAALQADPTNELVRPDTRTLSDGQYAARLSWTLGGLDIAGTYYYGFVRAPNVDITASGPLPADFDKISLSYDRLHIFGLDAATVLAGFNLRGEAAYYMSEDFEGSDDLRENNHSIQYVAGFDRNLPIGNLNLNVQTIGAYFFNESSEPTRNIVSAALSDSWDNDRIRPEVSASYGVEDEDWMIRPNLNFSLVDDMTLEIEYAIFFGDKEGRFGQFEENDYLEVRLSHSFF
ncbi:MAG: hypothetical protein ACP5IA_06745, partial [Sediminispirochaetaceae bacterium]